MSRILIIDDDRHMRTACSRALSRAGHTVAGAETGDEGLKEIQNGADNFDVEIIRAVLNLF
jgi:DNA-binding NtrC family response regulator